MISFERIQAGDTLWDVHSTRMGNTTMRKLGSWPVYVKEINHTEGWAIASWNGNAATKWSRHRLCKLRRSPAKGTE